MGSLVVCHAAVYPQVVYHMAACHVVASLQEAYHAVVCPLEVYRAAVYQLGVYRAAAYHHEAFHPDRHVHVPSSASSSCRGGSTAHRHHHLPTAVGDVVLVPNKVGEV
jgi:hypothetical protein